MGYMGDDWPSAPLMRDLVNKVHQCDAFELLESVPDNSVNCIVTSPPYFGLRDYKSPGQIGLEETPQAYVAKLVSLFREARRVLRDDGTFWLNLGDTYTGGGRGGNPPLSRHWKQGTNAGSMIENRTDVEGLPSKSLLGIPWRVAFGLQDDGWILRSDIIWSKPNPMPESVTDRPTKAHEYVFLFAKSGKYWYDADAIAEPCTDGDTSYPRGSNGALTKNKGRRLTGGDFSRRYADAQPAHGGMSHRLPYEKRNKRSVWTIPTEPNAFAHFATFPTNLIEPMILAGCPVGGLVLDPFMGSGTTALVARRHGRNYIGSELNPEYVAIARERLRLPFEERHVVVESKVDDLPLFAVVAS